MLLCDSLFEYFDLISQFIYLKVLIFFSSPLIQGEPGLARGLLVSGELYSPTGDPGLPPPSLIPREVPEHGEQAGGL